MPCFKGLAVSIHTPNGPIPEHSIQKQTRASRISSYIPVPPAKVPPGSLTGKPEQSTFAISITLLTPGLNVPYSTPKSTPEDPYPRPRIVGGLPGFVDTRNEGTIPPYIPQTNNLNETIAAYIYFDGRAKEEVATLLRRGEETWVNSRWVSVPESEGGGLAEREFLFREVGLERWLNGLDLEGTKDQKQAQVEKRHRRLEKRRRKQQEEHGSDDEDEPTSVRQLNRNGVLRYGGDAGSPVEDVGTDGFFSSDSDSEDEPPQAEAAGQIKVALFRVIASGEIKRGEYSPQFDAHDDDDNMDNSESNANGGDEDIDHTTSFAKPKTLDPKSISTQTVTGLDLPDAPYAVFTFFYRGEKQLQKMGILSTPESHTAPIVTKRKAPGADFSKLGPLNTAGTVGFSGYRDTTNAKRKAKAKDGDAMDSDADDEEEERLPRTNPDLDVQDIDGTLLSPEDVTRQGELAEGVQKIKLKRMHSAEPLSDHVSARKIKTDGSEGAATPQSVNSLSGNAGTPPDGLSPMRHADHLLDGVASPFKRQRASLPGLESTPPATAGSNSTVGAGASVSASSEPTAAPASLPATTFQPEIKTEKNKTESDEELSARPVGKKRKLYSCAIPLKRARHHFKHREAILFPGHGYWSE